MNKPEESAQPAATFEASLSELEHTVEQLEEGALPLEESLALFEKGVAALKRCHILLDQAEKRVKVLVKNARGDVQTRDITETAQTPPVDERPTPVPARKKSAVLSVDSKSANRENTAPLTTAEADAPKGDARPGGSLFGSPE